MFAALAMRTTKSEAYNASAGTRDIVVEFGCANVTNAGTELRGVKLLILPVVVTIAPVIGFTVDVSELIASLVVPAVAAAGPNTIE